MRVAPRRWYDFRVAFRTMAMRKSFLLLLAFVGTAAFAQGAYRWIGKDGKVHYSDDLPPAEARQIEEKRLDASVVGSDKYSYETRKAAHDFPLTLYVSGTCGEPCDAARRFLKSRSVPYVEKNLKSREDFAALKTAAQSEVVPTLTAGPMVSKGFQDAAWNTLLDSAGYPPAAPAKQP